MWGIRRPEFTANGALCHLRGFELEATEQRQRQKDAPGKGASLSQGTADIFAK